MDFFFSDTTLKILQTINPAQNEIGSSGVSFLRIGAGIGTAGAGTACIRSGGGAGTLAVIGATLVGSTAQAIVFQNLEVSCF